MNPCLTRAARAVILVLALAALDPSRANAAWVSDSLANTPICRELGDQVSPSACSDGAGGVVFTWTDSRAGRSPAYVERLAPSGDPAWAACGVPVGLGFCDEDFPAIAPDGSGGVYVFANLYLAGTDDILGQHMSASGTPLWMECGRPICQAAGAQTHAAAASDGAGGAWVVWSDQRFQNPAIRMQHVLPSGQTVLANGGVAVDSAAAYQIFPAICTDDAGGAIIAWIEGTGRTNSIVAAIRVDASGVAKYPKISVGNARGPDASVTLVPSGGGSFLICWADSNGTTQTTDLFLQGFGGDGTRRFPVRIGVGNTTNSQVMPAACADDQRGIIVAWQDDAGGNIDVRALRLDFFGNIVPGGWPTSGRRITTDASAQGHPAIAFDGAGGAVIAWTDYRDGVSGDLFAQRIRLDGSLGGAAFSLSGAAPTRGPAGSAVSVSGSGIPIDAKVLFDRTTDLSATITASQVSAHVPNAARSGPITVVSPRDGAARIAESFGVIRAHDLAFTQGSAAGRPWFAGFTPSASPNLDGKGTLHWSALGLGARDETVWRIFHWSPTDARFKELGVDQDSLELGQGYWIETRDAKTVSQNGVDVLWKDFRIPLASTAADTGAWHQLGNPFGVPLQGWQFILEHNGELFPVLDPANDALEQKVWVWDAANQRYLHIDSLGSVGAFQSFWVRALAGRGGVGDQNVLILAAPGAQGPIPVPTATEPLAGWRLGVTARQDDRASTPLEIGERDAGAAEPAVLTMPPSLDTGMLRVVSRPDGARSAERIRDLRAPDGGNEWRIEIRPAWSPGEIVLEFRDVGSTNSPQLALTDETGATIEVFETPFRLALPATPRALYLRRATPAETPRESDDPRALVWPNPSRGAVGFTIPVAGPARMRCDIHDLSGRLVRSLRSEATASGTHTMVWDGRDARGAEAPMGVYLATWSDEGRRVTGRLKVIRLR